MPQIKCPHCQASWSTPVPPSRCKECAGPLPSFPSDDLSLALKETITCQHCKKECYEDDLHEDELCPRCGKPAQADDEEESDELEGSRSPRRRPSGAGRTRGRKKSAGAKQASAPPPQKKTVMLTEEFKSRVYDAIKRADAPRAQQLCFEVAHQNEAHARQIYGHLLGVAKKNGWVGILRDAPEEPAQSTFAPAPNQAPPPPPPHGEPLEPLPLPAGILSPGSEPLPMPAGILSPESEPLPMPAGILSPGSEPLPMPAGILSAEPEPLRGNTGSGLLPRVPPPMPEPVYANTETAELTAPVEEDPEERGFLGRVAIEGRAAQVNLLCLAGRYAAARDLAQSTLARDPYAPRGHAALGEALAGLGDEKGALQAFTNAVRADANDPVCVRGYAQLLTRLGRHPEAINAYRQIVGPGKGEMKDAVALAEVLRKSGDGPGSRRVMEEVIKRDPQSLEPLRQQAEAMAGSGNLEAAADMLEQLLSQEHAPYASSLALAESLAPRVGASSRAREACGKVFIKVGKPFLAVRLLAQVAARNPQDLAARRTLGLAFARLGAGPQAEEQLLAVAKAGQADAQVFQALGEVYLERGDTSSGVRALERARDAMPQNVDVRRALSRALAAQGDLDGAIRELTAAHDNARSDDAALEDELDRITERAHTKRIKELEARLLANEEDSQARLQLAVALAHRGDLTEAIEHLQLVAGEQSFKAQALFKAEQIAEEWGTMPRQLAVLLASLHEENGSLAQALEALDRYLQASPEDGELRLRYLDLCARGERVQDAVAGLETFLEEAPPLYLDQAISLGERILESEGYASLGHPLARARRRLGDLEGAARLFQRFLQAEPGNTEARVEYARLLEGAGRRGEAYDVLKVLVEGAAGSTAELERLATLALGAGKIAEAVALLQRAVDRQPEDIALKHALEATAARLREVRIRQLQSSTDLDQRLQLAGLYAEHGSKAEAIQVLRGLGKLDASQPELSFLSFSAEHFAREGKHDKAEAALRQAGRTLGYPPGSEPHKDMLYRIATLYEQGGKRRAARRVFLEIFAVDPAFRDVSARLDVLSEDVRGVALGAADERVLELVDVGSPLGTLFDSLQSSDLDLDPKILAEGRKSSATLKAQSH